MTNTVSNPQSRMELLALAERVEKATGPDRELDGEIGMAVVKVPAGHSVEPDRRGNIIGLLRDGQGRVNANIAYRPFTASIDVAMTLAEGQEWCGGAIALLREAIDRLQLAGLGVEGLPQFLTAACLRSIAAMEGE